MQDYNFNNPKVWTEVNEIFLKPVNATFDPNDINFHVIYKIISWRSYVDNGFTLRSSLFGAVKLTKNV